MTELDKQTFDATRFGRYHLSATEEASIGSADGVETDERIGEGSEVGREFGLLEWLTSPPSKTITRACGKTSTSD